MTPVTPVSFLNMTTLSNVHTNTTSPNPQGCYNIIVKLFLSWNGTGPYTVSIQSFSLLLINNPIIKNATNTQSVSPNNQVSSVQVFPIAPVRLWVSFSNFCIGTTTPIFKINIYYFDGNKEFHDSIT